MTTAARPQWIRIDADIMRHNKFQTLQAHRQYRAIVAWIDCLGYCAEHLTDGWIPEGIPQRLGYTRKDMRMLVDVGLLHPMEINDQGGWLIHDYTAYQPTKQSWVETAEKRRKAARARWDRHQSNGQE